MLCHVFFLSVTSDVLIRGSHKRGFENSTSREAGGDFSLFYTIIVLSLRLYITYARLRETYPSALRARLILRAPLGTPPPLRGTPSINSGGVSEVFRVVNKKTESETRYIHTSMGGDYLDDRGLYSPRSAWNALRLAGSSLYEQRDS